MCETVAPAFTVWLVVFVEELEDFFVSALGAEAFADELELPGIVSFWPTRIRALELRLLALMIAWMLEPVRRAMCETVSPAFTVYVTVPLASGTGIAGAASGIWAAGSARTVCLENDVGTTVCGISGTSEVFPVGAAAAPAVGIPTLAATSASPSPAVVGRRRARVFADFMPVSHCVILVVLRMLRM